MTRGGESGAEEKLGIFDKRRRKWGRGDASMGENFKIISLGTAHRKGKVKPLYEICNHRLLLENENE